MNYALFLLMVLSSSAASGMNLRERRNNPSVIRDNKKTNIKKKAPITKKLSSDQLLERAIKEADELERKIIEVNKAFKLYLAREALAKQSFDN